MTIPTPLDVHLLLQSRHQAAPNPRTQRPRSTTVRADRAKELSTLITAMGATPADVAARIGCRKSSLVCYLRQQGTAPGWILKAVRVLAAHPGGR